MTTSISPWPPTTEQHRTETTDANKALIRRIFQEVIPAGDSATMRELVIPDWVDHDPLPGQPGGEAGAAYVVSTMHTAHPDLRFTIDDLVAEADLVTIRWTLRGTNTGPMLGRPPTGQSVELAAIVIFRILDGKIAERWAGWKPGHSPQTHPALAHAHSTAPSKEGDMNLLAGVNHVAVLTADLDRFVEFYTDVFDLDVVFEETNPAFRHAIIRTGPTSWLHPAEVAGNDFARASANTFQRGHLDHLALTAASAEAFQAIGDRLTQRAASDGSIEDLGAFHSIWFNDPDGMRGEVVLIVDDRLQGIHAPRQLQPAT